MRQGILTYALVRDGIEARQADFKPKDRVIKLAEWLEYGVDRVPKLYDEVKAGSVQSFGLASEQPKLVVLTSDGKRTGSSKELSQVLAESSKTTTAVQQPSLFDFARKRREAVLSVSN